MSMAGTGVYSIAGLAFRGVFRKLFRNSVLVLAVALLVGLLDFALLFNNIVQENLEAAARKLGADLVMVPAQAIANVEEFILESKEKTFYMDKGVYDQVAALPEIQAATYQIYLTTLASGCCSIVNGQVVAFDQQTDFVVKAWLPDAPALQPGQVYIGSYVYEYLGLIDTPTLFGTTVKVAAHLKKTGTGLDHGLFMRIEDLGSITAEAAGQYRPGMISIVFLKIKQGVDLEKLIATIQNQNPTIGIMRRGDIGQDVRATLMDIIRIFAFTILVSSVLAILLAWSTFTAMANERRREVGILRAIGGHRLHIVALFLLEAGIISLLGGLIGVGLGHLMVQFMGNNFHIISRLGTVTTLSFQNILLSGIALLAGVSVCLIGALAPVARLANMEPLVAIKEE